SSLRPEAPWRRRMEKCCNMAEQAAASRSRLSSPGAMRGLRNGGLRVEALRRECHLDGRPSALGLGCARVTVGGEFRLVCSAIEEVKPPAADQPKARIARHRGTAREP